ncbi:protein Peter pan [Harmonia axyridis]|uniref:protein Peter pan n=1 Tax=Harmonia axyridis TaxID=115357 RepID=UPI001E279251|nr:protein Peter pan [Harmonia axyridis]
MARKRKGRSVRKNQNRCGESEELVQAPHSFVICKGDNSIVGELTKDFRKVMEPFTASQLKTRKKNTIKDFVSIAGPLHVSHISVFKSTDIGLYLKIARLPRGPTLTFKVCKYSLAKDVISSLKKQYVVEEAFKHSPLIVLNGFSGEGLQLKMMASMMQNMFPTLNLTNVDLNDVRRVVLMNYNPTSKLIDFRHYGIKIAPVNISKGVKKVVQGKIPNLSKCSDMSEFLTKSGMLSESEAEDDPNNHVVLGQKIISRGNLESGKSSIKLSELGPRLTLKLLKIEDGLMDGDVLYHEFIQKTEEEKEAIKKKREEAKKLKEKRKKIQETNIRKKEEEKQSRKHKNNKETKEGQSLKRPLEEDNDEDDDVEYYRQEVGEEPDKDLFQRKPKPAQDHKQKNKKFKRSKDQKS